MFFNQIKTKKISKEKEVVEKTLKELLVEEEVTFKSHNLLKVTNKTDELSVQYLSLMHDIHDSKIRALRGRSSLQTGPAQVKKELLDAYMFRINSVLTEVSIRSVLAHTKDSIKELIKVLIKLDDLNHSFEERLKSFKTTLKELP